MVSGWFTTCRRPSIGGEYFHCSEHAPFKSRRRPVAAPSYLHLTLLSKRETNGVAQWFVAPRRNNCYGRHF